MLQVANITPSCINFFQGFIKCLKANNSNEIYTPLPNQLKQRLLTLAHGCLNSSDRHEEVFVPFMCLYAYPACNGPDSTFYPSSQGCSYIGSGVCQEELYSISALGKEMSLSRCNVLPTESCTSKSYLCTHTIDIYITMWYLMIRLKHMMLYNSHCLFVFFFSR